MAALTQALALRIAVGFIPTALLRRMAEPIAAGFSLFNLGKAEIGGFALEFRQTFIGGDIGLRKAGEL